MSGRANPGEPAPNRAEFQSTLWSVVLAARAQRSAESRAALETLCQTYWYPLYAYARRAGRGVHDAEDLVQGFFAKVLEKDFLRTADPERGRFRAFLLTLFQRFHARESERSRALKRGGGTRQTSLDISSGEARFLEEPSHDVTPEQVYERRWALTVMDRALESLRKRYEENGSLPQFEALQELLLREGQSEPYREVARRLKMTEVAVKVAVLRLRRRLGECLAMEISSTVESPADVEDELSHLAAALESPSPFTLSQKSRPRRR